MNTQDWSPLGWTGWISLQTKGLLRVFSNTTIQKHQFFGAQLSSQSNSHIHTWPQQHIKQTLMLTVLEAGRSRSRLQQIRCLVRAHFLAFRQDKSTFCCLFHKALIPLTRSPPLRPNYLPLATPARLQRMNLVPGGRSTYLQTIAIYKVTGIDCWANIMDYEGDRGWYHGKYQPLRIWHKERGKAKQLEKVFGVENPRETETDVLSYFHWHLKTSWVSDSICANSLEAGFWWHLITLPAGSMEWQKGCKILM